MIYFQSWAGGTSSSQSGIKLKFLPLQIWILTTIVFIGKHVFKKYRLSLTVSLKERRKLLLFFRSTFLEISRPGGGRGNPLQYSSLERGAWQATVHRVTKSWT